MGAFASGWEWILCAHLKQWEGVWVGAEKHVVSAGSSRGVGWQPAGFWVYDERRVIGLWACLCLWRAVGSMAPLLYFRHVLMTGMNESLL